MVPILLPEPRRYLAVRGSVARCLGVALALLLTMPRPGSGQKPRWEAAVWGGYATLANRHPEERSDANQSGAALRFLELAILYSPDLRLWVQYDNGLTLDAGRVRGERIDAPSLYTGGFIHWAGHLTTRLEGGWREIEGEGQRLVRGEQVFIVARPLVLRVGGWGAAGSRGTREFLAHGGFSWIPSPRFQLGTTAFYAPRTQTRHVEDRRLLLTAEYRSAEGWLFGGGAAGGRARFDDGVNQRILDGYLVLSAPLQGGHEARLLVRREEVARMRTLASLAVGMVLRFGGQ